MYVIISHLISILQLNATVHQSKKRITLFLDPLIYLSSFQVKVTTELNGPLSIIRITMSYFTAILGLIFKLHRMCLKTVPVIGQLLQCQTHRICNYSEALGGCNQQS